MSATKKRKAHAGRPSKVDELANSLQCRWEGCAKMVSQAEFASVEEARAHEMQHVSDISTKSGGDHTCRIIGCGKEFPNNSRLRKHLVLHSAKNFACTQCDKRFHEQLKLKRHEEVVHTGNKPFSCPDCPKQFSFKANLKTHQRTHSGERPFPCDFPGCRKSFAQASNRNAHMLTHANKDAAGGGRRKKRTKYEADEEEDEATTTAAAAGSLSLLAEHASSATPMREFQSPILPTHSSLLSPPTVSHHLSASSAFLPITPSSFSSTPQNTSTSSAASMSSASNGAVVAGLNRLLNSNGSDPLSNNAGQLQLNPMSFFPSSSAKSTSSSSSSSSASLNMFTPTMMSSFSTDSMGSRSLMMAPYTTNSNNSSNAAGSGGSGNVLHTSSGVVFPDSAGEMLRFLNNDTPKLSNMFDSKSL